MNLLNVLSKLGIPLYDHEEYSAITRVVLSPEEPLQCLV